MPVRRLVWPLFAALLASPALAADPPKPAAASGKPAAAGKPAADAGKGATTREAEDSASGAAGEEEGGRISEGSQVSKTLAQRIPSVTRRSFVKRGRVEVFPTLSLSLNDPFYDHVIGSVGISYHVLESLSIGLTGEYVQSVDSGVPVVRAGPAPTVDVDHARYGGRLDVAWSPFYGKVSLMAESVLHFDVYLVGGVGMVGREKNGMGIAGMLGVGEHLFFNRWVGLRVELQDQMFNLARNPAKPTEEKLQHLLTAVVGVSFFLPSSFAAEPL
jgi:outer membrane beta-barrel protein